MNTDRRKHSRVNTGNLISYVCMDGRGNETTQGMGRAVNISQEGILLETHKPIESKNILLTVICPKCGFAKTFDPTKFRNRHRRLKAKCRCREVFGFTLEFRMQYRKKAGLPGEYIIPRRGEKGEIIVEDLSMGGIRFENLGPHPIFIDDMLEVKFKLNNSWKSEIRKTVRVIWVIDRTVGVMFRESKGNDKDLGFYLRT